MSSRLIYNNVEIGYVHTQNLAQEMSKDDSGTDALYMHFRLAVSGIITLGFDLANQNRPGNSLPNSQTIGQDQSVGQLALRLRHYLLTPRRQLFFYAGGALLLQVPRGPAFPIPDGQIVLDAKNGPNPVRCDIKAISDTTFLVDYEIETWMVECGNDSPPVAPTVTTADQLRALPENQKPYVSNRWSESVSLDDTGTTKQKQRRGTLITRTDMFISPDQLREIVVPQIDRGFRRIRANYSMSADGTRLDYDIIDEEVYLQPPEPALRARGEYTEGSHEGGLRYGECFCELVGNKKTDKGDLLRTCIAVVMGKIRPNILTVVDPNTKKESWIGQVAISESLFEPIVSVRVRAKLKPPDKRILGLQVALENFTKKPLSGRLINNQQDDQLAPEFQNIRGTAGLVMIAAFLRDPCLAATAQLSTVQEGAGNPTLKTVPDGFPTLVTQDPPIIPANVFITSGTNPELSTIPADDDNLNYDDDTPGPGEEVEDTFGEEG